MAQKSWRSGGYDYEFVDDAPHRLICPICAKPLREPHLAVCCGKNFCESCLVEWSKNRGKNNCPHCRAEGKVFIHVVNKGLKSEVSELKIRCHHVRDGCKWVGQLGDLNSHLSSDSGCGYVEVTCPRRCPKNTFMARMLTTILGMIGERPVNINTIKRKDIQKHLEHECILRPYQCEHCSFQDDYHTITTEHYDMCLEFPLSCPNECGTPSITRKDMSAHRSICPNERMECPFKEVGCRKDVRRSGFDDHMASDVQQHLLLMMKAYKEMKLKVENHDKQLQAKRR